MQLLCFELLLLLTVINCQENCPSRPSGNENQNEQSLDDTDEVMKYEIGNSYMYKLETEVDIGVDRVSDDSESFRLETLAKITKGEGCTFCLQLGPVKITNKSGTVQEFDEHGGSLTFFYKDFRLGPNVFQEKRNDSRMSSSIKRAVISMLQTSVDEISGMESDIVGTCFTTYTISENQITKYKRINRCKYRLEESPANLVLSTVSLKDFTYSCTHKIKDKMVEKADCFETYEFDEMYNTVATINSTLTLVEVKSELSSDEVCSVNSDSQYSISWISYDNIGAQNEKLVETTKTLLETVAKDINSEFTNSEFLDNILTLAKLSGLLKDTEVIHKIEQIIEVIKKTFPDQMASSWLKEIFFTALSEKPNHATVEYIADLVKKVTFLPNEKFLVQLIKNFPWLRDFGSRTFSSAANMMKIFQEISLSKDLRMHLLNFIAEDVVHAMNICTEEHCYQNENFEFFWEEFKRQIQLLPVLEQIEAIGSLDSENFTSLCADTNSDSVAGSSVDELYCVRNSFRRFCEDYGMAKVREVLKNTNKPSDIRIQAYLAMQNCPNPDDILLVKNLFENPNENSDLLGFITSHVDSNAIQFRDNILSPLITAFKQKKPTGTMLSKHYAFDLVRENGLFIHLKADVVFPSNSFIPSGLNIQLFVETKNGRKFFHNLGIFTSNLETLVNEILHKFSNKNANADILVYLRHNEHTDYFRKFSLKELEKIFVDLYKKVMDYKKPDWLPIVLGDKNIQNFIPYTFLNSDKTTYTAGGIPISWNNNGKAFLFSALSTEGLQNWDWKTLSIKVKTNPKIGLLLSRSVTAGFDNYEIGIKKEANAHSAFNLQFSVSKTNDSNVNFRYDVPLEKIFSVVVSEKIRLTNFINYDYKSRPINQGKIVQDIQKCISATDIGLNICHCKKCIFQVGRSFCDLDVDVKLSPSLLGISLDFNNKQEENEKEIALDINKISQKNQTFRISNVYFQYATKETKEIVAVGVHSPWIHSDLKISGVNTKVLKELFVSFKKNGDQYTALLYYKEIENPAKDQFPEKNGILCGFPFYLFCNTEHEALVLVSSPKYNKTLTILSISVKQDYEEKISFRVTTGGPFKLVQGSFKADLSHNRVNTDGVADIEIVYKPVGSIRFKNSWIIEDYFQWKTVSEYGSYQNPNKHSIQYTFKLTTLPHFIVGESNKYTKEIISHELRSTQFPSPFFNFNFDVDKTRGPRASVDSAFRHILLAIRLSPFGDATRELTVLYENKGHKWESFSVFLLDNVFSVSHQGSSLSLKTLVDKQIGSLIGDIAWKLNWSKKFVSDISLIADSTAQERILNGLVKVQNYEYEIEKKRFIGTTPNGEQKTTYDFDLVEKPSGVNLMSYTILLEPKLKNIVLKLNNEKYLEYELSRKSEDFQFLHKFFIKDFADGNGIWKLNRNGSPFPIEINIDTKFLPKKLKLAAVFIVQLINDDSISVDTNVKWQSMAQEILSGKINGKAELNFLVYILDVLYDIQNNNELSQLRIHGNANNISESILSSPELEISLKTGDEDIFELKYRDVVHKSKEELWQFKFLVQNQTDIDIKIAEACQSTEIEDGYNHSTHLAQYVQGATIIVSKNGFPLSLAKFPSNIDLHFAGEMSIVDTRYKINGTSTQTWNGKANYTSGGGIVPKKEVIWTGVIDVYPSNDTSDYNTITEHSDAFYYDTKLKMVEDATLIRDFNGTLRFKIFPTSYGHYTTSKYDDSGKEHEKTVFYVDHNNKYQLELNYSINTGREITEINIPDMNTIQGSSEYTTMFESWSDFELSQKQWIKVPYFSEVPKEWETEIAYTNKDDSELKLVVRQSDVIIVGFLLDKEGLCEIKAGIDIKDYTSGFLIGFDRRISLNNIQIAFEIITIFPFLQMGRFSVNHKTGNPRSSFLADLNDYFEINGYYVPREQHYNVGLNISNILGLLFDMKLIDEDQRPNIHITLYDKGEKSFELSSDHSESETGNWNVTHNVIWNGTFIPDGIMIKSYLSKAGVTFNNASDTSTPITKEYVNANLEVTRKTEMDPNENILTLSIEIELEPNGPCHDVVCYRKSNSTKSCAAFSHNCFPLQLILLM